MTSEKLYYDQILQIIKDYLGPAAERFLTRQINSHFRKNHDELDKGDIQPLAIRIRSGLLVLTRDEAIVEEAYHRIAALADQ